MTSSDAHATSVAATDAGSIAARGSTMNAALLRPVSLPFHRAVFFTTRTLAFLLLALMASIAQAQAGRIVLSVGDVVAVRGADRVRLAAGATVNSGDSVVTGAES